MNPNGIVPSKETGAIATEGREIMNPTSWGAHLDATKFALRRGTKMLQLFNSSMMRARHSSETSKSSCARNASIPTSTKTALACAPYLRSSCEYEMKARAAGGFWIERLL